MVTRDWGLGTGKMRSHEKLEVWNMSIDFVKDIYALTKKLPDSERYGLTSQMQRASVSIPANIAEGAARQTKKEYIQFLYISRGSLSELDTLLCVTERVSLIDKYTHQLMHDKAQTLGRMLTGLIAALKKHS